jgi:hypothetical protein
MELGDTSFHSKKYCYFCKEHWQPEQSSYKRKTTHDDCLSPKWYSYHLVVILNSILKNIATFAKSTGSQNNASTKKNTIHDGNFNPKWYSSHIEKQTVSLIKTNIFFSKIYFTPGHFHGTIFPNMVISFVSTSTSKKIKK